jgi:hypothetical protein
MYLLSAGLALVLICTGCGSMEKIPFFGKEEKVSYYMHTVRWPGETMSIIAGWYTDDQNNWEKLADVNPDIHPNLIARDTEISIPEDLLQKRDPMPKYYVDSFYRKDKKKPPSYEPLTPSRETEKILYHVHTVQWSGESVSIIAGWYTGDIENWKALANANPKINPNFIIKGNTIRIPEYLLKTREPMPKDYVDSYYPKKKEEMDAPVEEEEPELFGPK